MFQTAKEDATMDQFRICPRSVARTATVSALAVILSACANRAVHPDEAPQPPRPSIPASSPLAKVKVGMGMKEVADLLGPPSDTSSHVTGKAFIPFYFGEDRAETVAYYRGLGRVIYSAASSSPRVTSVEYDPSETGYSR
jgi:hypothetical protein